MVVMKRASEADFIFVMSEYENEIRVLEFNGVEAISKPFRYNLKLAALDPELDFDAIVGSSAYLGIIGETGERYVNGIIRRFVHAGVGNKYTIYHAELVPNILPLTLRQNSRIFQEMTVADIIGKIFDDHGIQKDMYRISLSGNHPTREYCVQYRESDLNFISRLMEEEGIFYFFEHDDEKHVMVIADSSNIHTQLKPPTIVFNEQSGMVQNQENIYSYRFHQQIRPGVASLRDFNFELPSLGMEIMASVEEQQGTEGNLEVYDYPGLYNEPGLGSDLAVLRIEALRANRKVGIGQSVCRRFLPGYRFILSDHPCSAFNQEYLITRLITNAKQPSDVNASEETFAYNNRFECIPYSVPFRPSIITTKPVVEGIQTAIVVGPSGEEIYTDKYGRVKVQFHWDREGRNDERSSCWIRVSQGWAGPKWGAMFVPRIGQEVIIDFLEGDPDRPIIIGRVYNGENPTPYPLPDEKTKSTIKSDSSLGGGGSNEIRFEDNKGKEEVYIHAQKDMNEVIENNMTTKVGVDQSITVGNDQATNVGHNQTTSVGNDQTNSVGNNQSNTVANDQTIQIGHNRDDTVTNNFNEQVGNNKTVSVGNNHNESIGNNMTIDVGQNLTETVKLNYAETVILAMELSVGGAYIESVGLAKMETVGFQSTVNVGMGYSLNAKSITLQAKDQIVIKTGSAQITMKKDGNIEVKGKDIIIKGSGNVAIN